MHTNLVYFDLLEEEIFYGSRSRNGGAEAQLRDALGDRNVGGTLASAYSDGIALAGTAEAIQHVRVLNALTNRERWSGLLFETLHDFEAPIEDAWAAVRELGDTPDVAEIVATAGITNAQMWTEDGNEKARKRAAEILPSAAEIMSNSWRRDDQPDDDQVERVIDIPQALIDIGEINQADKAAAIVSPFVLSSIRDVLESGGERSAERAAGFARKVAAVFNAFDRAVGIKPELQSVRTFNFLDELRRAGGETLAQAFTEAYGTTE